MKLSEKLLKLSENIIFSRENQTPGMKGQYRVKAKRGDFESGYTNIA